jgi:hypothetical protein
MGNEELVTKAFAEVAARRVRQDLEWGGPAHDDGNTPADWDEMIFQRAMNLTGAGEPAPDYRDMLIDIAALAIAAIQSWDRLHPAAPEGGAE